MGDTEDNDLSNEGLRETLGKNWWSSWIIISVILSTCVESQIEVTDVPCFKNYFSGNYTLNFVKLRITKKLFYVYFDKLKTQST